MRRSLPCLLLVALVTSATAAEPKAKSLFDGKTLAGWEGDTKKTWRVEDGAIVGGSLETTVPRNEFLCTTKTYEDFELKVTFKLLGDRAKANAGVQFRTKTSPNTTRSAATRPTWARTTGVPSTTSRAATKYSSNPMRNSSRKS